MVDGKTHLIYEGGIARFVNDADYAAIMAANISAQTETAWLNSLPTDPPVGGGWWNNSGIATYSDAT